METLAPGLGAARLLALVYTEMATCPLPPPENELDVAIRGGERDPGMH